MSDYDALRQNMRYAPVKVNPEWEDITISGNYDRIVRAEFGEPPYDGQLDDVPVARGADTLFTDTPYLGPLGVSAELAGKALWDLFYRLDNMKPPLLPRLRPRPIDAIELDIARATIPAFRPEDC